MPHANEACRFSPALGSDMQAGPASPSHSEVVSALTGLDECDRIMNHAVASWHAPGALAEQRGWHRVRYDRPAVLTPLDERTGRFLEVHQIISGRDISPSGFSFTHLDPLTCRRAVITFAFERETPPFDAIILRLNWCRFTQAGIYQSGGKFLSLVDSPLPENPMLQELPYA